MSSLQYCFIAAAMAARRFARSSLDALGAVLQAIRPVRHHHFAGLQSLRDRLLVVLRRAKRDGTHTNRAVRVHDINKTARRSALNRSTRNDNLIVQRVDQQTYIDELLRE